CWMYTNATSIPYLITIDKLHQKLVTLKKATYITVYTISAIIPGILPLVIAVLSSNQKETLVNIIEENNLIVKYLNHAGAKLVELYFDSAPYDRNWLGRTYFTNYEFQNKLGLIKNRFLSLYKMNTEQPEVTEIDWG
ncbi:4832_t:CDS:2, partial [Dentiscutata heterogama]